MKGSASVQHESLEANRAAASKTVHLNDPAGLQGSDIHLLLCRRRKETTRDTVMFLCVFLMECIFSRYENRSHVEIRNRTVATKGTAITVCVMMATGRHVREASHQSH